MTIWAILPAAGIGQRMGSKIPKQYLAVNGAPVISWALRRLAAVAAIEKLVVVLHPADTHWKQLNVGAGLIDANSAALTEERLQYAIGGDERYQSVLNGLNFIEPEAKADDWVLVHDAVRPCVRSTDIEKLIRELENHPVGGLLGAPVDNTLKRVDQDFEVATTVDRSDLWNAFTPQMFRYEILKKAIQQAVVLHARITDEASAIERLGATPKMILGNKDNIKITHDVDLLMASNILKSQVAAT